MNDFVRTPETLVASDAEVAADQVQALQAEVAQLKELAATMAEDWLTLNRFLNRTAVDFHWCSTYEARLSQYNANFRVLRLQGRRDQAFVTDRYRQRDPHTLPAEVLQQLQMCEACRGGSAPNESSFTEMVVTLRRLTDYQVVRGVEHGTL